MMKNLLHFSVISLVFVGFSVVALGQAGATCAEAIPLACAQSVDGTNGLFPDDSSILPFCVGTYGTDGQVWYSFDVSNPFEVNLTLNNLSFTGSNFQVRGFIGDCNNLTCVLVADFPQGMSNPVFPFNGIGTIYIRISSSGGGQGDFHFEFECPGFENCSAQVPDCVDVNSWAYTLTVANDSWCCDSAWDGVCQNAYDLLSAACFTAPTPPCVQTWSAAYEQVVLNDPFCADVEWTNGCHQAYVALNGSCDFGCTNPDACNYDGWGIQQDNGSCLTIYGCTNPMADNYDPNAQCNDGSCIGFVCSVWPPACVTDISAYSQVIANDSFCCDNNWDTLCQNAYDSLTGTCFVAPTPPCVQIWSEAYALIVANDPYCADVEWTNGCHQAYVALNGSCDFGCTNPSACNYDGWGIQQDNGTCLMNFGCTNAMADNFDPNAQCDDGSCVGFICPVIPPACVVNMDAYNQVITNDTFCCTNIWDGVCQNAYDSLSYSCTCALAPPCVQFGSDAYLTVTANDPYCCQVAWDNDCQAAYLALSESCNLEGCMDVGACNYVPMTGIDDGSCTYALKLFVYYEFNQVNGYQPQFDSPVANHPVQLGTGEIFFSNASGIVTIPVSGPGVSEVSLLAAGNFVPLQGTQNLLLNPHCSQPTQLGLSNVEQTIALYAGMNISPIGNAVHCTLSNQQTVWVTNTGSTPLNGTLTMTHPSSMNPSGPTGGVAPASMTGGTVVWNVVNQMPGTQVQYNANYSGPGIAFLGANLEFDLAMAFEEGGAVVYENTINYHMPVICAYDPNDKQAEPVGYADPHFIHADTDIEYKIRFQNTGNFVAYDVTVNDVLDVSKLDVSTFVPVASSHSMMTCLQPNGVVDFIFSDIMLPDSTTNEPESHGWLVFRIRPVTDLAAGSMIENTANIYFDANPAIVTNTTWHTIIECAGLAAFDSETSTLCEGTEVGFASLLPYIDTYVWTVDGTDAGSGPVTSFTPMAGTYEVGLTVSNPLCEESEMVTVEVHPAPDAAIVQNGIELTAQGGTEWQWFLNGTAIEGATNQILATDEPGLYTVLVTNEFGCSDMSEGVLVTSVGEYAKMNLLLYPNPMTDRATLVLGAGMWAVDVFDASGRKVRGYENVTDRLEIMKWELAAGSYSVVVRGEGGEWSEMRLVVE